MQSKSAAKKAEQFLNGLRHSAQNPDSTVRLRWVLPYVREIEIKGNEYSLFLLAGVEHSGVGLASKALLQNRCRVVTGVLE